MRADERQYNDFGIDRDARDILSVGAKGVEGVVRPPLDLSSGAPLIPVVRPGGGDVVPCTFNISYDNNRASTEPASTPGALRAKPQAKTIAERGWSVWRRAAMDL